MRDRDKRRTDEGGNTPLGLGPRDRESATTGAAADTNVDAVASDPYATGDPERRLDDLGDRQRPSDHAVERERPDDAPARRAADPDSPYADEP